MRCRVSFVLIALAAGCNRVPSSGPIDVSVIGPALTGAAAGGRDVASAPAAALIGATGQGLLRFDAAGQVVPGLARRWNVSDSGRSLLFRLGDDDPRAGAVAGRLRAAIAPASTNPLKPLLGAVGQVDAVTPQVVDIELGAPRPNILPLFAQPALAMPRAGRGTGGPFDLVRLAGGVATLRLRPDPAHDPDEAAPVPLVVRLRGEGAGRAIARFAAGRAALVTGGRFADLAVARAAAVAAGTLRFDPVPGLFGLAFAGTDTGLTADPGRRAALALAVDRRRIGRALGVPGWAPATAIVPPGTPEIEQPAQPGWAGVTLADRQAHARALLAAWRAAGHPTPPLRVAMPAGPGARLLFALIAADWRAIGVPARAVGMDEPADLRLVDEVAPADTAAFYLRSFACDRGVPCTAIGDRVLIAARTTPSLAERGLLLTRADALIAATTPFVALGGPIRWSLVAPALDRYRDSPRAIHPLDELRTAIVR